MQELKESDIVYCKYGYGKVIKPPAPKPVEPIEPAESSGSTLPAEPVIPNDPRDSKQTILDTSSSSMELQANSVGNKQPEKLKSDTITEVKLSWGGNVYLEASELKKKISLKIKTFYGHRKTIKLDVDINFSVQQLKNILLESHLENAKILYNLRLIYPMGQMQELKVAGNTIEQYRIPDNSNLVLLAQMTFSWDNTMRGTGIKLSNSNLTATKVPGGDYQTILGNLMLSSGSHYWEIKVDRYSDEEDLFIGIARKEVDLYSKPMENGMFWGYMCLCAKKVGPDGVFTDYGYQAKKGDTIGVLLEFRSGIASLSFYRNETRCGVAFSGLSGSFYPALCMYYGDIQVTLDPKAPAPIS